MIVANERKVEWMDLLEIERKETVSREEVAKRLRTLADMLARQNELEFDRGGTHFKVRVPDEVHLKVELEVGTDESELEVELTW
jgi:amphi-Trp domain-containing protein